MSGHASGTRTRSPRTRIAGVLAFLAVLLVTASTVAPAANAASRAVPALMPAGDNDDKPCRHKPDTLYVPRDVQGHGFNFYCRDGVNSGFITIKNEDVCPPDPGWFENVTPMKEWADRHVTPNGTVDFGQLCDEPCKMFQHKEKDDPDKWDLEYEQCAKVKQISPGPTPCHEWEKLVKSLGKGVEPWSARDRANVSLCNSDNPVYQRAYRVPVWNDQNTYDRNDFTAPEELTGQLGPLLGIAMWIGIGVGVIGVLICAGQLAFAYRNGAEQPMIGMMWVFAGCVLIGGGSSVAKLVLW